MTDDDRTALRSWIQEVSATSEPLAFEDVMRRARAATTPSAAIEPETTPVMELNKETAMSRNRVLVTLAAVVLMGVVGLVIAGLRNGGDVGNDVTTDGTGLTETTFETAPTTTPTTTATTDPGPSAAERGAAFWEALAAGDREGTLALVDPTKRESSDISPFGRAETLSGNFDWYEAVGWRWELIECVDVDDGTAACTADARNAWSEALGIDPVAGTFIVKVGDAGVIEVNEDENAEFGFGNQWSAFVFSPFWTFVSNRYPDDANIMWGDTDVNPEVLRLFELNTARFVEEVENSG